MSSGGFYALRTLPGADGAATAPRDTAAKFADTLTTEALAKIAL
jgi:hypothetical protein